MRYKDFKNRRIVVYGAGAMGEAVMHLLQHKDIKIEYVLDKSVKTENIFKNDIKLIHPENIPSEVKGECDFIVAISACPYVEVADYLKKLGVNNIYSAGEYLSEIYCDIQLVNVWTVTKEMYIEALDNVKDLFYDNDSLLCYKMALDWFYLKNEHKDDYAEVTIDRNKYFPDFITSLFKKDEIMLDTSVLSGEYIDKFIEKTTPKNIVYGFLLKPNAISLADLQSKYSSYTNITIEDHELSDVNGEEEKMRIGIMKPYTEIKSHLVNTRTIDSCFENNGFSFLRVYSMSRILPIIEGAEKSIKKYRPIMAINIGHYESDFLNVPLMLKERLVDYNFFFRIHSYQGNDCIFYAVPKERVVSNGD